MKAPANNGLTAALIAAALDRKDPKAERLLMARLMPCVHGAVAHTVWRHGAWGRADVKDLIQQVLLALVTKDAKSLRAWDPTRGNKYIVRLAGWRTVDLLGKTPPADGPLLEEPVDPRSEEEEEEGDGDVLAQAGSLQALLVELRATLTHRERQVLEMHLANVPAAEIAARVGATTNVVYLALSRVRVKARVLVRRRKATAGA